jgi:crotonobetainyl-CoA:carnitine CoA-transferase CaiB-like acyl-CoA transferase
MTNLCYVSAWHMSLGETVGREKRSAHPNLVPSQLYKTKDGWIFLMCNKEKFWPILCHKIGRPEWGTDDRFKDFQARLAQRDLITEILDEALSEKTTDEWMAVFEGFVPSAPVYDVGQALDSTFTQSTGQIVDLATPSGMNVRTIGPAIRQPGVPPRAEAAPAMAADQRDILTSLGYTDADIGAMEAAGSL